MTIWQLIIKFIAVSIRSDIYAVNICYFMHIIHCVSKKRHYFGFGLL